MYQFSNLYFLMVVVYLHVRCANGQKLLPVWQWMDPDVKGLTWPADRLQGEVKACTCAFVDSKQQCIDSDARGLRASFACGYDNFRNRAGNDETLNGMRQYEPCYCSYNQGTKLKQSY